MGIDMLSGNAAEEYVRCNGDQLDAQKARERLRRIQNRQAPELRQAEGLRQQ